MFDELPGFWTPVLPVAEVGTRPVSIVLAGEPLVLFRGPEGVVALFDRCPHRGVALSLGKVVDGALECPFHGWRFGAGGACVHLPFNPGQVRPGPGAVPAREMGGMVWVFTGRVAEDEPVVPPALLRPGVLLAFQHEEWSTHWTRAMENMLDTPHLPWVHAGTIGKALRRGMKPDSTMTQEITDTSFGFEDRFRIDDRPPGQINWRRPNGMELLILDSRYGFVRMHAWCVPTTRNHTRMLIASAMDFGLLNPLLFLGVQPENPRRGPRGARIVTTAGGATAAGGGACPHRQGHLAFSELVFPDHRRSRPGPAGGARSE